MTLLPKDQIRRLDAAIVKVTDLEVRVSNEPIRRQIGEALELLMRAHGEAVRNVLSRKHYAPK